MSQPIAAATLDLSGSPGIVGGVIFTAPFNEEGVKARLQAFSIRLTDAGFAHFYRLYTGLRQKLYAGGVGSLPESAGRAEQIEARLKEIGYVQDPQQLRFYRIILASGGSPGLIRELLDGTLDQILRRLCQGVVEGHRLVKEVAPTSFLSSLEAADVYSINVGITSSSESKMLSAVFGSMIPPGAISRISELSPQVIRRKLLASEPIEAPTGMHGLMSASSFLQLQKLEAERETKINTAMAAMKLGHSAVDQAWRTPTNPEEILNALEATLPDATFQAEMVVALCSVLDHFLVLFRDSKEALNDFLKSFPVSLPGDERTRLIQSLLSVICGALKEEHSSDEIFGYADLVQAVFVNPWVPQLGQYLKVEDLSELPKVSK